MSTQLQFTTRLDCLGAGASLRSELQHAGWGAVEAAEAALVLVELAMNTIRHAGGGRASIEVARDRVTLVVDDDGAGFPDWVLERWRRGESVEAAFGEGGPPRRGLGAGLDSARRLAHSLELSNRDGGGARAIAQRNRQVRTR